MITRQITNKAGNVASAILTRGGSGIPLRVRFGGVNPIFLRFPKILCVMAKAPV